MTFLANNYLESLKLFDHLQIDRPIFNKFLTQIYKGYRRDVEYHNDLHGTDVM